MTYVLEPKSEEIQVRAMIKKGGTQRKLCNNSSSQQGGCGYERVNAMLKFTDNCEGKTSQQSREKHERNTSLRASLRANHKVIPLTNANAHLVVLVLAVLVPRLERSLSPLTISMQEVPLGPPGSSLRNRAA